MLSGEATLHCHSCLPSQRGSTLTGLPICSPEQHKMVALLNPIGLRKAKIVSNFGLSECNRIKGKNLENFSFTGSVNIMGDHKILVRLLSPHIVFQDLILIISIIFNEISQHNVET